jgi:asparagine synthase (glutamine-hydrolysing)
LGHWYMKEGEISNEVLDSFDGIFACVLSDERTGDFVAARDAMGICPLYWGTGADGSMWFASEMKALQDVCESFEIFPPVRRTAM